MADFIQYNLSGVAAPVFPTPGVTYSNAGVATYATTSAIGFTLSGDVTVGISVQVIALGGTTPGLVLEVANTDPQTYIQPQTGGAITSPGPGGMQVFGQ